MAAARQGLMKAAARFDLQRVTRGRDRLYALAESYIRNALRDLLTEVRTAVQKLHVALPRPLLCSSSWSVVAARTALAESSREKMAGFVRSMTMIGLCCVPACPQYQTAVVHVPVHVREVAAKLHRVEQQLRQKHPGKEPSLDEVAAAAGVSLTQAQRALHATGGALQVRGSRTPFSPCIKHLLLLVHIH
jgi:hypothetical protein